MITLKYLRRFRLWQIIFVLSFSNIFSQTLSPEIITTSGDYYTNPYSSLSVTIGEPLTETISDSSVILTQGFQQSSYVITVIEEILSDNFKVKVYPNPATDYINIDFNIKDHSDILIQLSDANGRILLKENINSESFSKKLNLNIYAAGTYFLRLTSEDYSKTYKIVKY